MRWQSVIIYVMLFVGFVFSDVPIYCQALQAQSAQSSLSLEVVFVKDSVNQSVDSTYFNVMRIKNPTDQPIEIEVRFELPEQWQLLSSASKKITLPPGKRRSVPVRVNIYRMALAKTPFQIYGQIFDVNGMMIQEASTTIVIPEIHRWEMALEDYEVYFFSGEKATRLSFKLSNKGNSDENIALGYFFNENYQLINEFKRQPAREVVLKPGQDSIIRFELQKRKGLNVKTPSRSSFSIYSSTPEKRYSRSIMISNYANVFSPDIQEESLPFTIESGAHSVLQDHSYRYVFNAFGHFNIDDHSDFAFNFSNFNLSDKGNFLDNSNYRLTYHRKGMVVGLGAVNSSLGRNLYSRNSINISKRFDLSETHSIEVFGSQDYKDPVSSLAAGHRLILGETKFLTTASYNLDGLRNMNSAVFSVNITDVPMLWAHSLDFSLTGIQEEHTGDIALQEKGLAYDVKYKGFIGENMNFVLSRREGSSEIPGTYKGLRSHALSTRYQSKNNRSTFGVEMEKSDKKPTPANGLVLQPTGDLSDQNIKLLFETRLNSVWNLGLFPSFDDYSSVRPGLLPGQENNYRSKAYDVELALRSRQGFSTNLILGHRQINMTAESQTEKEQNSVHVSMQYGKRGMGVKANYDKGPLITKGLYQWSGDTDFERVLVAPYINFKFFRNQVNLNVNCNLNYRLDSKLVFVTFFPSVEAILPRHWGLSLRSYSNYFQHIEDEFSSNAVYSTLEMKLKKSFSLIESKRSAAENLDFKVVVFKDENSNGAWDRAEKRVSNVLVKLNNEPERKGTDAEVRRFYESLMTSEEGAVRFKKIAMGSYQMQVIPLKGLEGYFIPDGNIREIDITESMTYHVPFIRANRVVGRLIVDRDKFSMKGLMNLTDIKVTAVDSLGNSYDALTDSDGGFVLYLPGERTYKVSTFNVFGSRFKLVNNHQVIDLLVDKEPILEFKFKENKRKLNIRRKSGKRSRSKTSSKGGVKTRKSNLKSAVPKSKNVSTTSKIATNKETETKNNTLQPAAKVNSIVAKKTPKQSETQPKKKVVENAVKPVQKTIQDTAPEPRANYFVVIGAFSNDKNADLLLDQISADYPDAGALYNPVSGVRYVYLKSFVKRSAAVEFITQKARNNYPDCWVFSR